jgi:methionyl-tRNA formyltransferase
VHFSLLPLFRGAAPVQWALIEGHEKTGVTIMQMDPGLDTGPILAVSEEEIRADDTAGTLGERLAVVGAALLLEVLDRLEPSEIVARPQDDDRATLAPKLSSSDAHVDWARPVTEVKNRIRAFTPRPGAWGMLGPRRLKILRAEISERASTGKPGTIHVVSPETLEVDTLTNRIVLEAVQPEGKSRMSGAEFIRGYRPRTGQVLG